MGGTFDEFRRDIASLKCKVEKLDSDVQSTNERLQSSLTLTVPRMSTVGGEKIDIGQPFEVYYDNAVQKLYDDMQIVLKKVREDVKQIDFKCEAEKFRGDMICANLGMDFKFCDENGVENQDGNHVDSTSNRLNEIEKSISDMPSFNGFVVTSSSNHGYTAFVRFLDDVDCIYKTSFTQLRRKA